MQNTLDYTFRVNIPLHKHGNYLITTEDEIEVFKLTKIN